MLSRALLALALAAVPAAASPVHVVTTVAFQYVPGDDDLGTVLEIDRGDRLLLENADPLGTHNLVSVDVRSDGYPLFDSGEQTALGLFSEVQGVSDLGPGTYAFYCSVHGFTSMSGTLRVT